MDAKARLFGMQSPDHAAVIAIDDDVTRRVAIGVPQARLASAKAVMPEAQARWPALQGPHNAQNAAVALAVADALGVPERTALDALESYASLPHRMQKVAEINGVLYINDSKATNAASTAPALSAWPAIDGKPRIHWILGGLAKSDNLDECAGGIPQYRLWLYHRRGRGAVCAAAARGGACREGMRAAGDGRDRGGGAGRAGRRRAAVAGLRLVRPVSRFRGAGRRIRGCRRGIGRPDQTGRHGMSDESGISGGDDPMAAANSAASLAQLDLALAPLRPRASSGKGPRARFDRAFAPLRATPRPLPRERTALAAWFWEIDRVLLGLIVVLIAIGLVAVAAASPVGAIDRSTSDVSVNSLHYFYRHLMWICVGVVVMITVSMLPRAQGPAHRRGPRHPVRHLPRAGPAGRHGDQRRDALARRHGAALQPSEFLKPVFVVAMALAAVAARARSVAARRAPDRHDDRHRRLAAHAPARFRPDRHVLRDVGGAAADGRRVDEADGRDRRGRPWPVRADLSVLRNGRQRINDFLGLNPDVGGGPDQVQLAHNTISHGGLFGVGPGGGTAKFNLPEAHTDYIFSVIGEEFGLVACIAIAILYFAIVARVLLRLLDEDDPFIILAAGGLAVEMAMQAIINMGVNVQLFPSKGMTLPFISYGGSSMIALCGGVGLLLAFTRRNPYMARSSNVVRRSGR